MLLCIHIELLNECNYSWVKGRVSSWSGSVGGLCWSDRWRNDWYRERVIVKDTEVTDVNGFACVGILVGKVEVKVDSEVTSVAKLAFDDTDCCNNAGLRARESTASLSERAGVRAGARVSVQTTKQDNQRGVGKEDEPPLLYTSTLLL